MLGVPRNASAVPGLAWPRRAEPPATFISAAQRPAPSGDSPSCPVAPLQTPSRRFAAPRGIRSSPGGGPTAPARGTSSTTSARYKGFDIILDHF